MEYTWDEDKNARNICERGLDFHDAWQVFESPTKLTVPARSRPEQEAREMALALVNGRVLALVYTRRGEAIRCISLRPVSRKERRIYGATGQDRDLHER